MQSTTLQKVIVSNHPSICQKYHYHAISTGGALCIQSFPEWVHWNSMVINAKNLIKRPIRDLMPLGHRQSNYWETYVYSYIPLGRKEEEGGGLKECQRERDTLNEKHTNVNQILFLSMAISHKTCSLTDGYKARYLPAPPHFHLALSPLSALHSACTRLRYQSFFSCRFLPYISASFA